MDEAAFIDLLRGKALSSPARGLQDDAAVYGDLVLTHDMMIGGIHYLTDADPADIAWKLVARNLSDLAAKGASPLGVLLGYILGDDEWDRRFAAGLADALCHFETALWGGDTAAGSSGVQSERVLGMTAIGKASHQPVPSRAGARVGDRLWVTGTLGAAYAGYRHDRDGALTGADAIQRFRRPEPRLAEGVAVAAHVTAMMDISDGLLLDCARLAKTSDVTISLDRDSIPITPHLPESAWPTALRWGDDYELLFTLPADAQPACAATCIGAVMAKRPGEPLLLDGIAPAADQPLGWEHRSNPA